MRTSAPAAALGILTALFATTGTASAHLPSERSVRVLVNPDVVGLSIVVDGSRFGAFDDDGDGALSRAEFDAHQAAIRSWVDARLQVLDADRAVLEPVLSDLPVPGYAELEADDPVAHIRIVRVYPNTADRPASVLAIHLFQGEQEDTPYFIQSAEFVLSGFVGSGSALIPLYPT